MTISAAWQMRMEDKIGSIEVGKYADFVVLEKNLFDVDPDDIAKIKVIATMMDGKFTYRAKRTKKSQVRADRRDANAASMIFARHFCCGGH